MRKKTSIWFSIIFCLTAASVAFGQPNLTVEGPESAARIDSKILEEGKLLVTVEDEKGEPIRNLSREDFTVLLNGKKAKVLSVEPLETSQDVSLNIVMVVDNSASMKQRNAVQPVLSAMDNLLSILRPIDNLNMVVFKDGETMSFNEYKLHVVTKKSSNPAELKAFLQESYGRGLTEKTYLYEAMLAGLSVVRNMPGETHKFMVVFSDGEDINSAFESSLVQKAARDIPNFEVYSIDYMPGKKLDPFLSAFSLDHGGKAWKATDAADLAPLFEEVSSKLIHRYVLAYRFLYPPKGTAALAPRRITVEEITTIDSSPMLNYVYFDEEQGVLPERYRRFARQQDTAQFSEKALRGGLDKYHNVLNVLGSRLRARPNATVRLVGCNSNYGKERGRADLSRARAESVRAYLQYIWGIDISRMAVEARNLPKVPSTSRIEEGRAENRRVEILCDAPGILYTVQSTYIEVRSDAESIELIPRFTSEHGLKSWKMEVFSDSGSVWTTRGDGAPPARILFPADVFTPENLSKFGMLKAKVTLVDAEGQAFETVTAPIVIDFIQLEKQKAENLGYMVEEKYALILFDFDRADIKDRNAAIVEQIVARMNARPDAAVNIVGHTDDIGKESYNVKLSERRAKAVYDQIASAVGDFGGRVVQYSGVGPSDPLYPNDLPENRALNRTVTVTLIYEMKE